MIERDPKDFRVWVKGANGVTCVKWQSDVEFRGDVQILGRYTHGQQFPGHDLNPKVSKGTGSTKKSEDIKKVEDIKEE